MQKHILYLHGFNSSPKSVKAIETQTFFQLYYPDIDFHCPQLASSPVAVIEQLEALMAHSEQQAKEAIQWYFIGSSLGGYFSTYFSEKYQSKAALINPAVKPFELLNEHLGDQINPYTNEVYQVEEKFIDDLKQLEQRFISKKHYLVMVQTGDEVLDYQQAVEKYHDCQVIVQEGGDHSFINYEHMLPKIALFFNV